MDQKSLRDLDRLESEGYRYTHVSAGIWLCHKGDGTTYQVTLRPNGSSCTCPAYRVCKHIRGAQILSKLVGAA